MKYFLLLITFLLTSCFSINSKVTRFYDPSFKNDVKKFVILYDYSDSNKDKELEFKYYSNKVSTKLQELGFIPVNSLEKANYAVRITYKLAGSYVRTEYKPLYKEIGGQEKISTISNNRGETVTAVEKTKPIRVQVGNEAINTTIYQKLFELTIAKVTNGKEGEQVYQSKAVNEDKNNNVKENLVCMIEAVFKNFWGKSGQEKNIRIKDECQQ